MSQSDSGTMSERMARLSPQQRELLLRELAARSRNAAIPRRSQPNTPLPLSPAQQRMWFFERLQPGTATYHVFAYCRLDGALDVVALERAFAQVLQRHDALRTSFHEREGESRQTIAAAVDFKLARVDLTHLPPAQREAEAQRLNEVETARPFDLSRPPLLRATLLQLDRDRYHLLIVLHHIVSDAWSIGVLMRELTQCYDALREGGVPALPDLPVQFADTVLWQSEPVH